MWSGVWENPLVVELVPSEWVSEDYSLQTAHLQGELLFPGRFSIYRLQIGEQNPGDMRVFPSRCCRE